MYYLLTPTYPAYPAKSRQIDPILLLKLTTRTRQMTTTMFV